MDIPLLSVVVPTRNEAENIGPLVERLRRVLGETSYELCFVDDSTDDSGEQLDALAAADPRHVRCLLRRDGQTAGGLSTAVVAGLRMARGEFVCVMDGDLQHPPELVPTLLLEAEQGADLVIASRYVGGGSSGGLAGGGRRLVSRAATVVTRLLFGEARRSTDPLAGFFLCRRQLVDDIEFRPVGFKILLELLVCLPQARVRDVPLCFQPRAAGQSKASLQQGMLFIRHLWSLVTEVDGSARVWKFGLVGCSGLMIFLSCLWLLGEALRLPALAAFIPAFALSVAWNTLLNRMVTFADQRRRTLGEGPMRYLKRALVSGLVMFASFAGLVMAHVELLLAGTMAAVVAMVINGLSNRAQIRLRPVIWTRVARDGGIQASLSRLAQEVGADRAFVLPASRRGAHPAAVPADLLARVVIRRRPAMWTEAASHRPQRRTNIEATSMLLLPVVDRDRVLAVVACERVARRGFAPDALEIATRAVDSLTAVIAAVMLVETVEPPLRARAPGAEPETATGEIPIR